LEHSCHGILRLPQMPESVTYVSGMMCNLCVGKLIKIFPPSFTYGSRSLKLTVPKTVPLSTQKIATRFWLSLDVYEDPTAGFRVIGPI